MYCHFVWKSTTVSGTARYWKHPIIHAIRKLFEDFTNRNCIVRSLWYPTCVRSRIGYNVYSCLWNRRLCRRKTKQAFGETVAHSTRTNELLQVTESPRSPMPTCHVVCEVTEVWFETYSNDGGARKHQRNYNVPRATPRRSRSKVTWVSVEKKKPKQRQRKEFTYSTRQRRSSGRTKVDIRMASAQTQHQSEHRSQRHSWRRPHEKNRFNENALSWAT